MTVRGKAYIAGIFEHPTRLAPDKTVAQLHAEVALGALADAGLTRDDVDGYFCSGDAPGPGPVSMAEYMNLHLRHMDSTEIGGASYIALAAHAAEAIALGKCDVALVTLCVISDGGGAIVLVRPEIAKTLKRPPVKIIGTGEAVKHLTGGTFNLTTSGAWRAGPIAFAEAGVTPADIKYASIYDSFTITVIMQLEDLGFCAKGAGGKFVADGNLISGVGKLPFNTDGGGLCSNHPVNRGGMTKIIEAVRQLRGEAHPKVQVKNCDLAIAHGTGGLLGIRHAASTCILERV